MNCKLYLQYREYKYLQNEHVSYYLDCIKTAAETLTSAPSNKELAQWVIAKGKIHVSMEKNADYGITGLIYQLFQFDLFKKILNTDSRQGAYKLRAVRNLALMTQIIGKYEYLNNISILTSSNIKKNVEDLFNLYLRLLYDGGISEYEDDSEYAPSGCVSFLTIHQSKGMEFPVVFVDSLQSSPRKQYTDFDVELEA